MAASDFATLGVSPGATAPELRQAYLDLAQIFHPDRFTHDERLQKKVEQKLVEINAAYERLRYQAPVEARAPQPASVYRHTAYGPASSAFVFQTAPRPYRIYRRRHRAGAGLGPAALVLGLAAMVLFFIGSNTGIAGASAGFPVAETTGYLEGTDALRTLPLSPGGSVVSPMDVGRWPGIDHVEFAPPALATAGTITLPETNGASRWLPSTSRSYPTEDRSGRP